MDGALVKARNPLDGKYYDVTPERAQYWSTPVGGGEQQVAKNPLDGKFYPVTPERAQFWSRPGLTLADTAAAMAPPAQPPEEEGVGLGDYAKSVMAGGASLAQGFGWLSRQVGADKIGSAIEELGRDAVEYWTSSMSDAAKDALSREFVRKNEETGDWEWGDATLNTVGLMGAQSLLGTAAGMGAGAAISKVLQTFANPLGRTVLAAAAKSGSIQAANKLKLVDRVLTAGVTDAVGAAKRLRAVDAVIGALGFGAGEGLIGGMQAGQGVEAAVRLLPPETLLRNERYQEIFNSTDDRMSELERHQYATDTIAREASSEAGWQAGLVTALLGAPMGAYFGRIIGQSGRMATTRLGSVAVGAAGEAAQEFAQSGAEAGISVAARQRVGEQDLDLLEEAFNEAIGGAAAGGLLGGAVGAVDFQPADVPRGTPKPDVIAPLKNAMMRAAQAGAPREAVLAEATRANTAVIDRIANLRKLEQQAAAAPEPPPAPPTFAEVLAPVQSEPPKERTAPTPLDVVSTIDEAAHQAATSPLNEKRPPTAEEIEAENYEAGRVAGSDVGIRGADFVIEYPRGADRGGLTMRNHYGRIPGTVGGDGMALDFFMGNEDQADRVYLYHHLDSEGRFAQHKALLNMSREEAQATLQEFYGRGRGVTGPVVELTKAEFEEWVARGRHGEPHPKADLKAPRKYEGAPARAVTAGGEAVNARYTLMELGDLVSSHTLTGKPNARFPQELQPRDRSRAGLAMEANRPTISTFSATEQANSDARALTDNEIAMFAPSSDGSVLADSNRQFVQAFVAKMPATERAGLMTAEGAPTRQLANRIQAAIFSKAYQDDRLLTLMAEEASPDVRNIISALTSAAPAFARARAAGVLEQADVVTPLIGAIEVVRQARAKGQSVQEYLGQQGLFGNTSPDVDRMARFIDSNIRSAKRMGEAFTAMASFLESEGSRRQTGALFGEEAPLDVGLAMQAANQRMEATYGGGAGQAALFSRAPPTAPASPKLAFVQGQLGWSIAEIYEHALPNQARLSSLFDELESELGVKTKNPGAKQRARFEQKFGNEGYGSPGEVVDVVRGAVLASTPEQADAILRTIQQRYPIFDKGVQVTPSGYVDRKVLVKFPDGQVGEIQIAPPSIFAAKYEQGGEAMYVEQRALLKDGQPTDPLKWQSLRDKQIELYAHAVAGTPWQPVVEAVGYEAVNQVLNLSRQAPSGMMPPSASAEPRSVGTQPAPGEGTTNAAIPPAAVEPMTPGRSSSETNQRTVETGSSTESIVARERVQRVTRWMEPELRALAPIVNVQIVDTVAELPHPNAPPDVEGAYTQDGAVYFVASNLPTEARARAVARHEVFGHMAIERNTRFRARLNAIMRAIRAGNLKPLVREVRARQGLLPPTIEAREVVALMAERGINSPLLGSFRAALREVGRELGLDMPVDEAELTALVRAAAKDLRRDAAMMQDFLAAQRRAPGVVGALEKAAPSDAEILAALDEIYGPNDYLDSYRTTPSGKRVPRTDALYSRGRVTADQADTDAFKRWAGKAAEQVVRAEDGGSYEGGPAVFEAYHGTTHDGIEVVNTSPETGTTDSFLGRGFYVSTSIEDVNANYAGVGPDLTGRIDRAADDLGTSFAEDPFVRDDVMRDWIDGAEGARERVADRLDVPADFDYDELQDSDVELAADTFGDDAIKWVATQQTKGRAHGLVMPVWVKFENPLDLRPGAPGLEYEYDQDENGDIVEGSERGNAVELVQALNGLADRYGIDVGGAVERALDGASPFDVFGALRGVEAYDDEGNMLTAGGLMQEAARDAGFDGMVMDADFEFGSGRRGFGGARLTGMKGVEPGTLHMIPFEATQVKSSVGNRGTFDPNDRDPNDRRITYSRAGAIPSSAPNEIQAILDRVMAPRAESLTIRDRARELWRRLTNVNANAIRQGVIDSFDAIKQLERGKLGALADASESAYKAALATRNLPSVMAAVMMRGVPVYKQGAFQLEDGRKGVIEIFQPLTEHAEGNLLPLWELYAAAYRERDVMRTKKDYKPLFDASERRAALALAEQYPELETARAEWEEFNGQLLDLAAERGVLDPAAVKAWKQNFYVPFYRAMEEAAAGGEGPKPKGGLEGHGAAKVKKRLRGSEKPLGDVFGNMLMNTAYLIDESFKNTAMQRIVALGEGVAMERIPLKWDAVQLPAGQLEKALDQLGAIVLGFKPDPTSPTGKSWAPGLTADEREEWVKLFRRVAPVGKDVVSVYESGKPVYYRVTDDLLLRSIGHMGHDNFEDVLGLFRGSKRLLTSAITLDPAFMMANWVRDTLSAWVTSDASMKPIIDSVRGAKAAFEMQPEVLSMMAAGGGGGGVYDMQPAELRTFLADKLGSKSAATRFMGTIVSPKNWLRAWRRIGNAAENANRVAVFRAVRAAGGTVAEAAYQARDVLNFTMSGDYAAMRWLTATIPFMNARIQGLYRLWRGAQDNPTAFAMKGIALTAATLALLLRNNDEEEYERLPEWDKDMYWHFWMGGEHFRLPKPFEVGAIFGTIPERMFRVGTGRDSARLLKERVMAMVGETFAFNPIPQLAKPMIEQYANRSFFFGSPIVGMAEANLEPEAQYTPWTSETMKLMAEALPDWAPAWMRSPLRLEAALRGYVGTLGTYALQASDVLAREAVGAPPRPARKLYDAPVVRRFLQDPNPRYTKYSDQLYDMLEEANSVFRTINRYREEGRGEDAQRLIEENRGKLAVRARLNRISTRVRAINNQMQLVLFSQSLSPEEKRRRLDELTAAKNAATAQVAPFAPLF